MTGISLTSSSCLRFPPWRQIPVCDHRVVEINCWERRGGKTTLRVPRPKPELITALQAAIDEVRATDSDDISVASELPSSVPAWLRSAARLVLGLGSVLVTVLLLALFVVDTETRGTLVLSLVVVIGVGGLFVMVVGRLDVTVTIHRNGQLVRKGWNGFTEIDLRDCQRVTINADRSTGTDESRLPVDRRRERHRPDT